MDAVLPPIASDGDPPPSPLRRLTTHDPSPRLVAAHLRPQASGSGRGCNVYFIRCWPTLFFRPSRCLRPASILATCRYPGAEPLGLNRICIDAACVAHAGGRHTGLTDFLQESFRIACFLAGRFIWRDFRFLYLNSSQICHPQSPDIWDPSPLCQITITALPELTSADDTEHSAIPPFPAPGPFFCSRPEYNATTLLPMSS